MKKAFPPLFATPMRRPRYLPCALCGCLLSIKKKAMGAGPWLSGSSIGRGQSRHPKSDGRAHLLDDRLLAPLLSIPHHFLAALGLSPKIIFILHVPCLVSIKFWNFGICMATGNRSSGGRPGGDAGSGDEYHADDDTGNTSPPYGTDGEGNIKDRERDRRDGIA